MKKKKYYTGINFPSVLYMTDILFGFFQSNLSGFYDPCPEEEKMLRIRYLFREAVHEVTVGDTEPVRIPKQCKEYCVVLLWWPILQ